MLAAILALVTALSPSVRPCDTSITPTCEKYAENLANIVHRVSAVTHVPEDVLLAIAYSESRLNRRNHGGKKGWGIMGLNTYSNHYNYARAMCDLYQKNCLEIQVATGAEVFMIERKRCKSLMGGLAAYNTGKCDSEHGLTVYAPYVMSTVKKIRRMKK